MQELEAIYFVNPLSELTCNPPRQGRRSGAYPHSPCYELALSLSSYAFYYPYRYTHPDALDRLRATDLSISLIAGNDWLRAPIPFPVLRSVC